MAYRQAGTQAANELKATHKESDINLNAFERPAVCLFINGWHYNSLEYK
jgi:hypothetical protein